MRLSVLSVGLLLLTACGGNKSITDYETVYLDTMFVEDVAKPVYRASNTRVMDLIHTDLDVRFDWDKQYLHGKAELTMKPYFYETNTFGLDAQGFDIESVEVELRGESLDFDYAYDQRVITFELNESISRNDTLLVFIDYVSKPNELQVQGSEAITDAKGLYFIDPLDQDPLKPSQIWTQGETQASSAWFPTIDSPNEKMTQEIAITVQDKYLTLSNGVLEYSEDLGYGLRTDHWVQEKAHAPYLAMMTVGEFAETEDMWRDSMAVNYYVEKEYGEHAQRIFGKTPEMIEFYSNVLGVDFPWANYKQVVVRDYVSGAMENTTAVIFGEFTQQTTREMIDGDNQAVISHELFHHWFGDLVTCESWSNLPLNESFATYGEYLWFEHDRGKDFADEHLDEDLQNYMAEFKSGKSVDLVRFHYDDPMDMFDSHSYAKGGRILHMLRSEIGDEAFFASLNLYLTRYAYQPAEMHQLRLCVEEVTGRDMSIFFNQWFFAKGHPVLNVSYGYDQLNNKQVVYVEQVQDLDQYPLYELNVFVTIDNGDHDLCEKITINSIRDTFRFEVAKDPAYVVFDSEASLLAEVTEEKTMEHYAVEFDAVEKYYHRKRIMDIAESQIGDKTAQAIMMKALNDPYDGLRAKALDAISDYITMSNADSLRTIVVDLMTSDASSRVRAAAARQLEHVLNKESQMAAESQLKQDSSYAVIGELLMAVYAWNPDLAKSMAADLENEPSNDMLLSIAELYAFYDTPDKFEYYHKLDQRLKGWDRLGLFETWSSYLAGASNFEQVTAGLEALKAEVENADSHWYISYSALEAIFTVREYKKKMIEEGALTEQEQYAAERIVSKVNVILRSIDRGAIHENLKYLYFQYGL